MRGFSADRPLRPLLTSALRPRGGGEGASELMNTGQGREGSILAALMPLLMACLGSRAKAKEEERASFQHSGPAELCEQGPA